MGGPNAGRRIARWNDDPLGFKKRSHDPKLLVDFLLLTDQFVRPEDDTDRMDTGGFAPDERDNAEGGRGAIFEALILTPGRKAFDQLLWLEDNPRSEGWASKCHREHLAYERAEKDAFQQPFKIEEMFRLAAAVAAPKNPKDLFVQSCWLVEDLKQDIEASDSSPSQIWARATETEEELRLLFARELRRHLNTRVILGEEEQDTAQKRPDIKFKSLGVDAIIPLELKIYENWTGPELADKIASQLINQ